MELPQRSTRGITWHSALFVLPMMGIVGLHLFLSLIRPEGKPAPRRKPTEDELEQAKKSFPNNVEVAGA